jgi:hypothetical protein
MASSCRSLSTRDRACHVGAHRLRVRALLRPRSGPTAGDVSHGLRRERLLTEPSRSCLGRSPGRFRPILQEARWAKDTADLAGLAGFVEDLALVEPMSDMLLYPVLRSLPSPKPVGGAPGRSQPEPAQNMCSPRSTTDSSAGRRSSGASSK